MHILGTAGHVDHGKSSLVRALTGTDPDRWIEERLRGMTLDLGFAHLRFADGVEAGIIDVPGHERFLHNMLAGACGMELLLLVVAANEGPKRQTLEHLEILQYLSVRKTMVVLSKADTVDAEGLAFATELVREGTRGTLAADAAILPVSTLTGAGLADLRSAIHDAILSLPERLPSAPAYLPIDRVFALPGYGTIVTGTLLQGRIAAGDQLRLAPPGRDVRVRSLQIFGEKRDEVSGGARVAANLPGVETSEIARGAVLASAQFPVAATVDVRFRALPRAVAMLRRRTPVRAYIGSAEILGTLAFATVPVDAGEVDARLHLREPAVIVRGAPFVVRRLSPKDVLGGGTLAASEAHSEQSGNDAPETEAVLASLKAAGLAGATAASIGAIANLREEVAETQLARLADEGRAALLQKPPAYVSAALLDDLTESVRARLLEHERVAPWAMGLTSLALARLLAQPEDVLFRALAALVDDGRVAYRHGYYATPQFVPELSAEQLAVIDGAFAGKTAEPVPLPELTLRLKESKIPGAGQALETLFASGALVKVADVAYRGARIAEIRERLESALRRDKEITMAGFRDLVGTSRKYAVPLLEWFDAAGVTLRTGDVRVLRAARSRTKDS